MLQVDKAEDFVTKILQSQLSPLLTYHDYFHTQDVMQAAMALAKEEGGIGENDLLLLRTAALFHDCGYVKTYDNHESEGCRIAERTLPGLGYSAEHISTICNMIMKTRLPSSPETPLEKILCDADLDYLGRDDFKNLGDKLFTEFHAMKKIGNKKEWDELQVRFLEGHHYWTASAIKKRGEKKERNLQALKLKLQS